LPEGAAAGICLDFDLAVADFGRWVDDRRKATREVPVSKAERKKQVKHVPRYPTLAAALGLPQEPPTARKRTKRTTPETTSEVDRKVEQFRKDPAALLDFLRLDGDA